MIFHWPCIHLPRLGICWAPPDLSFWGSPIEKYDWSCVLVNIIIVLVNFVKFWSYLLMAVCRRKLKRWFCWSYFCGCSNIILLVGGVRMYIGITGKRNRAVKEVGKVNMSVGIIAYYQVMQVCQVNHNCKFYSAVIVCCYSSHIWSVWNFILVVSLFIPNHYQL